MERLPGVVPGLRLHAHDAKAGKQPLRGRGGTREESPTAHRDDQQVERIDRLDELQGHRPLPGHDHGLVVGRDDGEPSLGGQARPDLLPVFDVTVVADHLGPVRHRGCHLLGRRVIRHDDQGGGSDQRGGDGHRLRVVAG